MDKHEYIKALASSSFVLEKGYLEIKDEGGGPGSCFYDEGDCSAQDVHSWISRLLSAAYDQGAASKDIMSTESPALALAEERCKALEEKLKKQDKALAKIADLIGLDEQSQPFQIIDRVRTQAACQKTMDEYLEHIAETVGLPSGSTWASVSRRVSEVQAMWKEALAQANRDADEILHLKAKAKEWEAASRNARQQGFDEAVAVVDRCIEVDEDGIEKAKDRVSCLKNIAGALRGAVLCDDE